MNYTYTKTRNCSSVLAILSLLCFSACGSLVGINGRSEITSVESQLYPKPQREHRVELSGFSLWVLKRTASLFIKGDEPELADLLKSLKEVRFSQYSVKELSHKEKQRAVDLYTSKLLKKGWETTVKVFDENEYVAVLTLVEKKQIGLFLVNINQNDMVVVKLSCHQNALKKLERFIYAKSGGDILRFNLY